jgi:hypothetical protein
MLEWNVSSNRFFRIWYRIAVSMSYIFSIGTVFHREPG